jgi:hypothetical protein
VTPYPKVVAVQVMVILVDLEVVPGLAQALAQALRQVSVLVQAKPPHRAQLTVLSGYLRSLTVA